MSDPIAFPRGRRPPKPRDVERIVDTAATPPADLYAAILRRLDALAEELAAIEDLVLRTAARQGRRG